MKKEIITIAGALGAGKSSVAKRVAHELGYTHFSSGDLFRAIALERELTIEEINTTAELETAIDHDVDERLRALGEQDKLVIDSRLAYYWIPDSFKVYLDLDIPTAAERIYKQIHSEGRTVQAASSIEELVHTTEMRKQSEQKRYKNLYGLDVADLKPFNVVVNTAHHNLDEVVKIVLDAYRDFLENA